MRVLYIIAISLSLAFAGGDALGKSRAGRRGSGADRRHSSGRGTAAHARARSTRERARSTRERARSTREHARRGERVSSRGRRGREERYARGSRRGRHGRDRYARGGRRREPREIVAASNSRPAAGGIPTERATEIQNALIKAGYLSGPPSGQYDDATSSAMRKFQSANGMPATGLPSAASLKKLGVAKRSNDGYAVPIKSATQHDSSPPAGRDAAKPKP